jgi:hypothetical protein
MSVSPTGMELVLLVLTQKTKHTSSCSLFARCVIPAKAGIHSQYSWAQMDPELFPNFGASCNSGLTYAPKCQGPLYTDLGNRVSISKLEH